MPKKVVQLTEDHLTQIIHGVLTEVYDTPHKGQLNELGMDRSTLSDKYGEVIGAIVDNLVAICLYQDNSTVPHWKSRAMGLCQRFVNIDMVPLSNNNYKKRKKALEHGVSVELNHDYSTIKNHIKSVAAYYAHRSNEQDRLYTTKNIEECYEEYMPILIDAVKTITEYVAQQDNASLTTFIENFSA